MSPIAPARRRARLPHILLLAAALAMAAPPPGAAAEGLSGPYLAARQAIVANDFSAAAHYLAAALATDPDNPQMLEQAVVAHLALGDISAAVPPAQRLSDLGLDSQPASMALIVGLLVDEAHDEALVALRSGEGIGALVDALLAGWTQVARGRMSEALETFDALAGERGSEAFGLYHKALALAHAGDFEGAEHILSGEAQGPLRLTRRGAIARAQILGQIDRQDDAAELLEQAFGDDPDPEIAQMRAILADGGAPPFDLITRPRDGMAEVFFDVAGTLQGEAMDSFTLLFARLALVLRRDHVPAALMSGRLMGALGQHELAADTYAEVPETAPLYHLAAIGLAEALHRAGQAEEARATLEALAQSHAGLATVHSALGDMLRRERDFDAASRAYDAAIALLGEPQPQHWSVYYTRAITHEREGRWPEAEADFRLALELNPDDAHVLNYLGYSLVERRENLDEALDMIRRAVAAEPDNGYIVDSLGWVYYRLGRYDEALEHMERAVELLPADAVLNDHLGDVYWAVGRKMEARFQWRRALSLGPADDLDMDRIRRKLEVGLDEVLIEEGAEPHHRTAAHGN